MNRCFIDILHKSELISKELIWTYSLIEVFGDELLLVYQNNVSLYSFTINGNDTTMCSLHLINRYYIRLPAKITNLIVSKHKIYLTTNRTSLMSFYRNNPRHSLFEMHYLTFISLLKEDLIITSDKIGYMRLYRIRNGFNLLFEKNIHDILSNAILINSIIYFLTINGTKGVIVCAK